MGDASLADHGGDLGTCKHDLQSPWWWFLLNALIKILTQWFLGIIYNLYFHPLAGFPGPKSFAASNIPHAYSLVQGLLPYKVTELHQRYGDVVRVEPNSLSFTNVASWKDIYSSRPPLLKDPVVYAQGIGGPDLLTVQNAEDHTRYKRLLTHAFSEKALREQEPLIKKYVDLFISKLQENAAGKKAQDMVLWYNYFTFELIGDLSLGESFGCLDQSDYHPWVAAVYNAFKLLHMTGAVCKFPFLKKVLDRLVPQSLKNAELEHYNFTKTKVQNRINLKTDRPDFMSYVLQENGKETGMTEREMIASFAILLLAGSETTSTTLSVATYQLLKNPETMARLVDEIRGSFDKEEDITMVSVNKLKYQLAVIEESLRIQAPAPGPMPRIVPGKGAKINGFWVPGGVSVSCLVMRCVLLAANRGLQTLVEMNAYTPAHVSSNFVEPYAFRPERWLNDPRFKDDVKGASQPFGVGPRACIGRK